jgi:anhydro-N-acetylmuramic acid kinase
MAAESKIRTAIGLMSGTSMDGIDAALIRTDGQAIQEFGPCLSLPYDEGFRGRLRGVLRRDANDKRLSDIERNLTTRHARAVEQLIAENGIAPNTVDLIGFHGQTLDHRPDEGITLQIGDGAFLASETGIPVVNDFRSNDVASGGEGAPFASLYHQALARELGKPMVVLNLGGVANVTWIGAGEDIVAFDTGPASALIDDWVAQKQDQTMDVDGKLAAVGTVDDAILLRMLDQPYFAKNPPKSLDRGDFDLDLVGSLNVADGAATLTAFTAKSVAAARAHFPQPAKQWLVTGGGRKNPTMMKRLADEVGVSVEPVENVGWDGDNLEAQAFAFLGVRSIGNLPLSLPTTTGVAQPMTGGQLHLPPGYCGEL